MAQNPVVTFTMENGDVMKAELYPDIAPVSVNNFISLIQKNFYDGLIFHRVIRGFMIQGGDPQGTGMGGPGYSIKGEFAANGFQNDLKPCTKTLPIWMAPMLPLARSLKVWMLSTRSQRPLRTILTDRWKIRRSLLLR